MNRVLAILMRAPWALLIALFGLCAMSVYNLHSTSIAAGNTIYLRHFYWMLIGGVGMLIVAAIDYRSLQRFVPLFYVGVFLLLVLVLLIGKEINGSKRWINLGFVGFQPSELAKLAAILSLASWFQRVPRPGGYTLKDLLPVALLIGLPMLMILLEPDLGHTLMILFISGTMLAFERFERRAVVTLLILGIAFSPLAWHFVLRDYQKSRILTLINSGADAHGAGWHARQARVAVGSGGFFGKGHGHGTQVAGGFLPENHTDFVFANLAEEQGFLGGLLVIGLYLTLIISALRSASQARDRFGRHVAVGVGALIFWHVLMNMGMVLNVLPVTGVTLPILSYGGTSVVTVMAAMGLLLNIHLRRTVF